MNLESDNHLYYDHSYCDCLVIYYNHMYYDPAMIAYFNAMIYYDHRTLK